MSAIETLNTKIASLMNKDINVIVNSTFSTTHKWPTALIID